uniref:Secreted protein n=1 Tax=Knipowitschia caucasica TaxID=637954 RepID=A0AAV2KTH4_KNICA
MLPMVCVKRCLLMMQWVSTLQFLSEVTEPVPFNGGGGLVGSHPSRSALWSQRHPGPAVPARALRACRGPESLPGPSEPSTRALGFSPQPPLFD